MRHPIVLLADWMLLIDFGARHVGYSNGSDNGTSPRGN